MRYIETIFGSRRVTNFTQDGKEYSIILQGDIKDRQEPDSISKVFVRSNNNGKLVSISNLVEYKEEGQSPFLARYNRQKAVTISGDATKACVLGLPSFRLAKFRLNEVIIEFFLPSSLLCRFHCPIHGPHALART